MTDSRHVGNGENEILREVDLSDSPSVQVVFGKENIPRRIERQAERVVNRGGQRIHVVLVVIARIAARSVDRSGLESRACDGRDAVGGEIDAPDLVAGAGLREIQIVSGRRRRPAPASHTKTNSWGRRLRWGRDPARQRLAPARTGCFARADPPQRDLVARNGGCEYRKRAERRGRAADLAGTRVVRLRSAGPMSRSPADGSADRIRRREAHAAIVDADGQRPCEGAGRRHVIDVRRTAELHAWTVVTAAAARVR